MVDVVKVINQNPLDQQREVFRFRRFWILKYEQLDSSKKTKIRAQKSITKSFTHVLQK